MAGVRRTYAMGTRRQAATPIQRAPAGSLWQPRQIGSSPNALFRPNVGGSINLTGGAVATNRANPTAPAGSDPRNVGLLLAIEPTNFGKGR